MALSFALKIAPKVGSKMTAERGVKKKQLPRHGSVRRYKLGCHCGTCTEANTAARQRERAAAAERAGKPVPTPRKRVPTKLKPGPTKPARPVVVSVGAPDFEEQVREAFSVRRPRHDDRLAQIIDDALFESRGDESTAAVVAAERIRDEGWRPFQGAVERAMRKALGAAADDMTALRHEVVLRGARVLDDPDAGRNYKSTVDAIRAVLADLKDSGGGAADAAAAIMAAIRGTGGGGDPAPVGDSA